MGSGDPFFLLSILVGEPSPKKVGKRALLGDLVGIPKGTKSVGWYSQGGILFLPCRADAGPRLVHAVGAPVRDEGLALRKHLAQMAKL